MMSRLGSFLLAAVFLAVSGADAAVLSIPAALGAPGVLGMPAITPSAAPFAGLGFTLPSALSLTPALTAVPAVPLRPAALTPVALMAAAGRVRIIRDFDSRILGNRRDVAVYFPPGYEEGSVRYPVLYVQDGQNIFDPATAYGGTDWGLAQTCDRLIKAGEMAPVIIVAPYNTSGRAGEYTPVPDAGYGGGNGDAYGRFLSDELKPFVDANLRTRPE
jgi:hypothetical protein